MKTLKQILEVYAPKPGDEKRFVKKHVTIKHADANGNGDDVFTASNVKTIDRKKEKKGHDAKTSEAVYEEYDVLVIDEARTSSSYQFTHKPGDTESEKKLADLKSKHKGTSQRVVLKGRLGKDNPSAQKYKDAAKANKGRGYGASAYQTIKKADAAHHDVYVYRKATEEVEVNEVLKVSAGAGEWIKDFQGSDNPKFAGKSKEQRKQQALAAFYAAKRSGKD
jgi:hypothetical protein